MSSLVDETRDVRGIKIENGGINWTPTELEREIEREKESENGRA